MSKRLNRSGPNFMQDFAGPQGRFMDAPNYKKLYPKAFDFCEILKCAKKYLKVREIFFVSIVFCTKKEDTRR